MIRRHDSFDWEAPAPIDPARAEAPTTAVGLIDPLAILRFLATYWGRAVKFALAGLLIAIAFYFVQPTRYAATALILVDPRTPRITLSEDVLPGIGNDAIALESLVQVATSDGFLNPIFDRLDIASDPEFNKGGLFGFGSAPTRLGMLARFADHLKIERRGVTYVVEVTFTSKDREKAARYANAVAEAFVAQQAGTRVEAATEAADWLKNRLTALADAVRNSEAAVAEARAEYGIVNAGNASTVRERELSDLVQQVAVARSRAEDTAARYEQARISATDPLSESPEGATSSVLSSLRIQHADLKRQAAELALVYGARHPRLQALDVQIQSNESQIRVEVDRQIAQADRAARASREQLVALEAQLARLEQEATSTDESLVKVRALEREAEANRRLYEEFLSRFKSTNEQTSLQRSEARIVSPATPPLKSTKLSVVILGIAGTLVGLLAGFGSALLQEAVVASGLVRRRDTARPEPAARDVEVEVANEAVVRGPARVAPSRVDAEKTAPAPRASAAAAPAHDADTLLAMEDVARSLREPADAAPMPTTSTSGEEADRHTLRYRARRASLLGEGESDEASPAAAATDQPTGRDPELAALVAPWVELMTRSGDLEAPLQVVLVAAATSRSGHRDVARALAEAAADAGLTTVLVATDAAADAGTDVSGITDVVAGAVSLPEVLRIDDERPLMRLGFGTAGSQVDPLTRPELLDLLEDLRSHTAAVIVEGPASGAEPRLRGLVGQADALLVVAEEGRIGARAAEIVVEQLAPHEECLCRLATWPKSERVEDAPRFAAI